MVNYDNMFLHRYTFSPLVVRLAAIVHNRLKGHGKTNKTLGTSLFTGSVPKLIICEYFRNEYFRIRYNTLVID